MAGTLTNLESLTGYHFREVLSGQQETPGAKRDRARIVPVTVQSRAFKDGGWIPDRYSATGANVSPPLSWGAAPEGTRQWFIMCEDPDAPGREPFVHWVVTVPPEVEGLPEGASLAGLPEGARQGRNSLGTVGYFGPRPPRGHGPHHYHFEVFAVDTEVALNAKSTREGIIHSLEGHTLAYGQLVGIFEQR